MVDLDLIVIYTSFNLLVIVIYECVGTIAQEFNAT